MTAPPLVGCVFWSPFFIAIRSISNCVLFIILLRYVNNVSLDRPLARLPSTNPVTTKLSISYVPRNSAVYERSLSIIICVCSYNCIPLHWLACISMRFLLFFCITRSSVLRAFSSYLHFLSTFHILTFSLHCHNFLILTRY